jgi:hypothetical protein
LTAISALVALAGSVAMAFSVANAGDYPNQVGPAVRALAEGRLGDFFQLQPVYGAFSALVRAPLAAIALHFDGGELLIYRLGALACLLPLVALGVLLARWTAERGQPAPVCVAACAFAVVNPATFAAVENGHPEEVLAGALVIGTALAAIRGRCVWTGLLLGLALTTKQWTALAVLPLLVVSGRGRRARVGVAAAAVAAALTLPLVLASPETFGSNARATQGTTSYVSRFSVWWPLSSARTETVSLGNETRSVVRRKLPRSITGTGRPLAVILSIGLLYLYVRRSSPNTPEDVLALLALIFLLRCILDPLNNSYYHVAFLLSLLGWEGLRRSGLPVLTLLSGAALWATFHDPLLGHAVLDNGFYLSWTASLVVWLALSIYTPRARNALRKPLGARAGFAVGATGPTIHVSNT